jgi:hypothetical protein
MQTDIQSELGRIIEFLQRPWWNRLDFWIGLIAVLVGVAGLVYSILAFREARKAKHEAQEARKAATAAGRTVRLQTVAIELSEIIQKLERLQRGILFDQAQELLNEISRRLRRFVSPFQDDGKLSPSISLCLGALESAQKSLNSVRPTDPAREAEVPGVVYLAIQGDFATINNSIAGLQGLFEKESFHFGDYDGKS